MRDPENAMRIGRLKCRADFLRVAKGKRWHGKAMSVQAAESPEADQTRVGFTLTRKVGNAIVRNRARRRLKEAVRITPDLPVVLGHDYVIVGRIDAIRQPFESLKRDLARAIQSLHRAAVHQPGRQPGEHRPKRTARPR